MATSNAAVGAAPLLTVCLHVTSAEAVPLILEKGLLPRIGPLSALAESRPGIFLFPSWHDLESANWLFDEACWPHASEPALLGVDVRGIELELEAGFEVVARKPLEPARITVLSPGETGWDVARQRFHAMGGREDVLASKEVAAWLRLQDSMAQEVQPAFRAKSR